MSDRLVLPLEPTETFSRESFRIGVNKHLFLTLFNHDNLWVYGAPAVGKTHAVHILASEHNGTVLVTDSDYDLIGLEEFSTVVIDGIDQWIGDLEIEKNLVGLCECLAQTDHRFVITSRSNLEFTHFRLPDLKSRIGMFSRFHILPVPPAEQLEFLQDLVKRFGTTLSEQVARFILRHITRSQAGLVNAVNRLNQESIYRNRNISISMVKEVFGL